ncbi:MAG: SurA N-terminal domain-containing protein [Bacillota bacterium]|nr:SurA N-terminal domain-containing protein [Bacillota bacterium]
MLLFRGFRGKKGSRLAKAIIIVISVTFVGGLAYTGTVFMRRPSESEAGIVASVDGKRIGWEVVDSRFKDALLEEYENTGRVLPETRGPIRASAVEQLINSVLISEAIKKEKIQVPAKQVEAELKRQRDAFPNDEAFRAALKENNLTASDLKRQIRDSLAVQTMFSLVTSSVSVSEDAVKAAYTKETGKPAEGQEFEGKRAGIRERLEAEARQDALVAWLDGLRKNAKIEIFDPEIRAVKKLQEGAYDEAIAEYGEAIKKQPDNAYLYVGLAQAHLGKKDLAGATQALEKARDVYPEEPYIRLLLGTVYRDAGAREKARHELKAASEHGGLDILLHIRLESLFQSMGMNDDAKAENEKVSEIRGLLERRSGAAKAPTGSGSGSPNGS